MESPQLYGAKDFPDDNESTKIWEMESLGRSIDCQHAEERITPLVTVYDSCVHVGFALKEMGLVSVCAYVVI